jgi:two-component system chemotaxis response regulator CheY
MINSEKDLAEEYLAEWCEHLVTVETDLHAIEKAGVNFSDKLANRVFRTMHSVRGAGFFGLAKISDLAMQTEAVLELIRSREMLPTRHRIGVLMRAAAQLYELVQDHSASNQADTAETMAALARLRADHVNSQAKRPAAVRKNLRALIAEDDYTSRLLLESFLSKYAECRVAANGREAVEAVRAALDRGQGYDLICMDIMMPEMDGRDAVRLIRAMEEARGIFSARSAKIIMTTAVDDVKDVVRCFMELCDSYLLKPIDLNELLSQMKSYQLVP